MAGKTAVVTGGTGFLGVSVVEALLRDGWRVLVSWVEEEEVSRIRDRVGSPEALILHPADVTDADSVEELLGQVEEIHAGVLLVGGFAMAPVAETDPAEWERMVALNATSVFQSARQILPRLDSAGGGSLVTVAAEPALERGAKGMGAYAATKAAVVSLTQTLAREGGAAGVNVNAVAPRIIDTPANREAMPDADTSSWLKPAEIAEVVAFLLRPEGRIVNGSVLALNKG